MHGRALIEEKGTSQVSGDSVRRFFFVTSQVNEKTWGSGTNPTL